MVLKADLLLQEDKLFLIPLKSSQDLLLASAIFDWGIKLYLLLSSSFDNG